MSHFFSSTPMWNFLIAWRFCIGHHTFLIVFGHRRAKMPVAFQCRNAKSSLVVTLQWTAPNLGDPFEMQDDFTRKRGGEGP